MLITAKASLYYQSKSISYQIHVIWNGIMSMFILVENDIAYRLNDINANVDHDNTTFA